MFIPAQHVIKFGCGITEVQQTHDALAYRPEDPDFDTKP